MIKRIIINNGMDFLDYMHRSDGTVEIVDIAVNSERRKGHGRDLVRTLVNNYCGDAKLVYAITRETNRIAQQFYISRGFRLLGILRRYYRDTSGHEEDALMFGLDLPEGRSEA